MNPSTILLAAESVISNDDVTSLLFFAKVAGVLITLLGSAYLIIAIWNMLRTQPPVSAVYATKEELAAVDTRLMAEIREIQIARQKSVKDLHDKFDLNFRAIQTTLATGMQDINRSVGQLEGSAKMKSELLEVLREVHRAH